jgi:predicted metal-binding membrane protein
MLVAGVMNFLWAIALTIFVLLEKVSLTEINFPSMGRSSSSVGSRS